MKNLILIGFMGAGKTTLGQLISKTTGRPFVDTDERIVLEHGMSVPAIFEQYGEAYFRDLETAVLKSMLSDTKGSVISVGGGLPVREENRALLRKLGCVVYLTTKKETILDRVSNDGSRPMLNGDDLEARVEGLMKAREALYEEAAHLKVPTDDWTPELLIDRILQESLEIEHNL